MYMLKHVYVKVWEKDWTQTDRCVVVVAEQTEKPTVEASPALYYGCYTVEFRLRELRERLFVILNHIYQFENMY